jgi:general secretion pathway protein H
VTGSAPRRLARQAGFTLIELMVVIGLIGLMVGLVRLTVVNDPAQTLSRDAERMVHGLQAAGSEAAATGRPLRLVAIEGGWAFEQRQRASDDPALWANTTWARIEHDDVLGPHQFQSAGASVSYAGDGVLLGVEPIGAVWELRVTNSARQIRIYSDGLSAVPSLETVQ